ncbi:monofunctional biosynthetic peptidoglycan transglycosylase [Maritimibacter sp. DP1N21-5]|uniref:monofunctional biosynthetic peptidoglycan transglycosylase n=1 Tax=Maritimibacter sp. DP1N21-5 TaxID=2836867 RepID=UPI001C48F901|nr:monofunctional biosynthetic peptidoglycan transglycosylase [Maritimibacter sp. DP1N21-5]MBV7410884.1 monofunctional biosynthetic peptidoglycan transglycosylase [Maritimibacter sp. DP1N21-5]
MARACRDTPKKQRIRPGRWVVRFVGRWLRRAALALVALVCVGISLFAVVNPPVTPYQLAERMRLGSIERDWIPMEDMAPVMARSVVAAEDANFCLHWGFDMEAIRQVIEAGENRGASTLSQQVVKNVFLWHGRNYTRKALEGLITPAMELVWTKRRIVEVYLNVVEFDEGVFGVGAAAPHYFGVSARDLTATQAALLAAVLPDPKGRDAARPSAFMQRRSASIRDGAETIRVDGRSECFED